MTTEVAEAPDSTVLRIRSELPSKRSRLLKGDLDNIVLKALRKEPSRRYLSVEQFAEDIRRHLHGLPVTATPDSLSYRAGKFVQRHKIGVGAVVVILLAILGGTAATIREARIAAANARRAERRYNDVRKLANSLIFEVHDSIYTLPGAGKARQIILQRAEEYLDSLAKESGNEADLQRELATVYERIGSLQGNPMDPNLGNIKDAAASMQKAVQIRESLVRSNPHSAKDQVDLAIIYLSVTEFKLGVEGDVNTAFEFCKKAQAILDQEMAADPSNLRTVLQDVRAYSTLGFLQIGNGSTGTVGTVKEGVDAAQKALLLDQRAEQLSPNSVSARGQEAVIDVLLGDGMLKLGDRPHGMEHFHRALHIVNSMAGSSNNIILLANGDVIMSKIGDAFLIEGKIGEATAWYRKDQVGAAQLLATDPSNEVVQRLIITSSGQLGHALIEGGRVNEGLTFLHLALSKIETQPNQTPLIRTFDGIAREWIGEGAERQGKIVDAVSEYRKSQGVFASLRAGGTNDLRRQVYYCSSTDRLAAALLKLGKTEEAQKQYDDSRTVLEPLLEANPTNMEVMYALAETYTGEGDVSSLEAKKASLVRQKTIHSNTAADWYQKSLTIWDKVTNPAWISTSLQEVTVPAKVSRRLAEIRGHQPGLVSASTN